MGRTHRASGVPPSFGAVIKRACVVRPGWVLGSIKSNAAADLVVPCTYIFTNRFARHVERVVIRHISGFLLDPSALGGAAASQGRRK